MQIQTARTVDLIELEERFHLTLSDDLSIFPEWQSELPELSQDDKKRCDRIKTSYTYLLRYPPLLENTVKLVVLSPLLDLAGFFLPPFRIQSEASTEIISEDGELKVTGFLDVLVLFDRVWVLAIESKQAAFSLEVGRAQLLSYLLSNPRVKEQPMYGLLTNGSNFVFVKLIPEEDGFTYTFSDEFSVRKHENELVRVLQVLKRLATIPISVDLEG